MFVDCNFQQIFLKTPQVQNSDKTLWNFCQDGLNVLNESTRRGRNRCPLCATSCTKIFNCCDTGVRSKKSSMFGVTRESNVTFACCKNGVKCNDQRFSVLRRENLKSPSGLDQNKLIEHANKPAWFVHFFFFFWFVCFPWSPLPLF